jgi:hypothetical protein
MENAKAKMNDLKWSNKNRIDKMECQNSKVKYWLVLGINFMENAAITVGIWVFLRQLTVRDSAHRFRKGWRNTA